MNLALNLLGLLLTAALVENPFYTRCFMAETVDAQLNERRDVMLRSIIAAGMCLPAARIYRQQIKIYLIIYQSKKYFAGGILCLSLKA